MSERNKWGIAAVLAAAVLTGLAGCGTAQEKPVQKETKVITDIAGSQVTVPEQPQKIAVVPLPWASVIYALDGTAEHMTAIHPGAMSAYRGHFLERMAPDFGKLDTKLIGQDFSIHMESAAGMGVDTAILWAYQDKEAAKLQELGIPAVRINNENIDQLKQSFLIVGKFLGKEERAQAVCAAYDNAYDGITRHKAEVAAAEKPVLLYLKNKQLSLQGTDNFIHEAIDIGGGQMPFGQVANGKGNPTIQMEEVYKLDPDIILLSNFDPFVPDDLYENRIPGQDWSTVKAVKNHRVYKVPMGIYRWDAPGVETPLMMRWLARVLQPDIFRDIHVREDTKAFYKDFMHYDLTDADMAQIFADAANAHSLPLNL